MGYIVPFVGLAWFIILSIDCFRSSSKIAGNAWVILISGIVFLLFGIYIIIFLPGMWKVSSLGFFFVGGLYTLFGRIGTKKK